MRSINELIWHCTATPEGREVSVAEIDRWHKQRGWNGIGYHKVVHLDGSVSNGRPIATMGAHVKGHNRGTIGYVYVGGLDKSGNPKDTRTDAQKATMIRLSQEAVRDYGIKKISGHRDYAAKACPCFDASGEYRWIVTGMPSRDPVRLMKSRTAVGSTVAAAAGVGTAVEATQDAISGTQDGLQTISLGGVLPMLIGLLAVFGALLALYARWDDAGRPGFKEMFS
nr:N-acetylmuramoyl-L-alanine amidase [uncultured Cohaesibacter sp.]